MESRKLRRNLIIAFLALLVALLAVSAATFAWYVYHTAVRTSVVKLSAGSNVALQISNEEKGHYSSSTTMGKFNTRNPLVPMSTDKIILGTDEEGEEILGFQRAIHFTERENYILADKFSWIAKGEAYYKTSLYLKTNAGTMDVYLSRFGWQDKDTRNPISTAMRLGLVVEENGKTRELIYELNPKANPAVGTEQEGILMDNGAKPPAGYKGSHYVLQSSANYSNETVGFDDTLLGKHNCYDYNTGTGQASLKPDAYSGKTRVCTVSGDGNGGSGEPVKVDVYLWLEGCDPDCTLNLAGKSMQFVSLIFEGQTGSGG